MWVLVDPAEIINPALYDGVPAYPIIFDYVFYLVNN